MLNWDLTKFFDKEREFLNLYKLFRKRTLSDSEYNGSDLVYSSGSVPILVIFKGPVSGMGFSRETDPVNPTWIRTHRPARCPPATGFELSTK